MGGAPCDTFSWLKNLDVAPQNYIRYLKNLVGLVIVTNHAKVCHLNIEVIHLFKRNPFTFHLLCIYVLGLYILLDIHIIIELLDDLGK